MATQSAPVRADAVAYGHSRWAAAAGAALVVLGLMAVAFGLLLVVQGVMRDNSDQMGYGMLAAVIGGLLAGFGGLEVIVAVGIWRHASWARYVGLFLALIGAAITGIVLPTAFNMQYGSAGSLGEIRVELGLNPTSVILGLSFFPYLVVLAGLILGGNHFRRVERSPVS